MSALYHAVIVVSLQTVVVALVLTILITPAAAAQLLTRRLSTMMIVAAVIGVLSNVTGLYISYYWNIASGPTMVLVATVVFVLVFIFAPERGVLWRSLRRPQVGAVPGICLS